MNDSQFPSLLIFTDLDGTLLSETGYDPGPARPLLQRCRQASIPVIFCSSKTAAEIIALKQTLDNPDPFICENGGAIYIPKGTLPLSGHPIRDEGEFEIIEIGQPVSRLREILKKAAAETGTIVKGVEDLTLQEMCHLTGLTPAAAERAMKRCYDEPFILVKGDPGRLRAAIERRGCTMTRGGRFFHILQGCDKGHAVQILTDIYRKQRDRVLTIGLGDAPNDEPLFQAVDRAFLVQKTPGHWVDLPSLPHLEKIEGVGPEGWVHAVSRLLASVFPAS